MTDQSSNAILSHITTSIIDDVRLDKRTFSFILSLYFLMVEQFNLIIIFFSYPTRPYLTSLKWLLEKLEWNFHNECPALVQEKL